MSTSEGFSIEASMDTLSEIHQKYRDMSTSTIPILQDIQESFGYVPEEAVTWIAKKLDVPSSTFYGVATFYSMFHLKPRGKNIVTVCCGTACHVKGAEKVLSKAQTELGLDDEKITTDDMEFTLEKVACLGTCSMAPAALINKKMHGAVKPSQIAREIKKLKNKDRG